MKTLISYVAFLALILTSSFTIDTQQQMNEKASGCFSHFRLHRQAQGVGLNWAVSSPDVSQFLIERSYDDYNYEEAGIVPGNSASTYRYFDKEVFPGFIHYRIVAIKTDGTTECSPVEKVRIVKKH
jgi:hypothetical protein